jgi:hypothetical protein
MFQDITTLLLDHKAFKDTVDIFVDRYRDMHISVVAGTNYSHALLFFFLFIKKTHLVFYFSLNQDIVTCSSIFLKILFTKIK